MEVRKQYQINISNRFAALDNLNNSQDIHRAWENTKENIKGCTNVPPSYDRMQPILK